MTKPKKLTVIFLCIYAVLVIACIAHITLDYILIANDVATSAPAYIAFLLLIPYGIVAIVVAIVWLIVAKIRINK